MSLRLLAELIRRAIGCSDGNSFHSMSGCHKVATPRTLLDFDDRTIAPSYISSGVVRMEEAYMLHHVTMMLTEEVALRSLACFRAKKLVEALRKSSGQTTASLPQNYPTSSSNA